MDQVSQPPRQPRGTLAAVLNLACPGSGLILLRREWLGLSIVMLTTVLSLVTVTGFWIAPADVPRWLTLSSFIALIAVWILAQRLALMRWRQIRSPQLAAEVRELCRRGAEALAAGDLETAHRCLIVALNVDDEDPEALMHWARLMERMQETGAARAGWRRVLATSRDPAVRDAARKALDRSQ